MYYYIPIFKTKLHVEKPLLESQLTAFFTLYNMIPYLEITKDYFGNGDKYKTCPKMRASLKNILHFEEFVNVKHESTSALLMKYSQIDREDPFIIASFRVSPHRFNGMKDDLANIIKERHEKNLQSAIRIRSGVSLEIVESALEILNKDDWLIIDLEEAKYGSMILLAQQILELRHENTAIFVNERPLNPTGETYSNCSYEDLMNTSLLAEVKQKRFKFRAFGSYASLKDNLSEAGGASDCYGVFLLYNGDQNAFYSIRTKEKKHISKVYTQVKDIVSKELEKKDSELNMIVKNPLVKNALDRTLSKPCPRAVDFLQVSVLQFITEIIKLIS